MSLYIFINVTIALFLSLGIYFEKKNIIFFFPSVILIAFNILIFSHSNSQDHLVTINSFNENDIFFEPFFAYLTRALSFVFKDEFVLAITFLIVVIISYLAIGSKARVALLTAILLQFQTGLISTRIFLAIIICSVGLYAFSRTSRLSAIIIAPLVHTASVVLIPIVIFKNFINLQNLIYFFGLLIFVVVLIVDLNIIEILVNVAQNFFGRDYYYYLSSDIGDDGKLSAFSIIKFVLPALFIYVCSNFKINIYFMLALAALIIKLTLWQFEPLSRITNLLLIMSMAYLSIKRTNLSLLLLLTYSLGLNILLFYEPRANETYYYYEEGLLNLFG